MVFSPFNAFAVSVRLLHKMVLIKPAGDFKQPSHSLGVPVFLFFRSVNFSIPLIVDTI